MIVENRTASMIRLEVVLLVALDTSGRVEDDMFDCLAFFKSKG
jgi:hypothetical protein